MKHETCEKCGASLDFGERCDCESNIHNALPAAHSDKLNASLDMPKEVSGNVKIEKHAQSELSNQSAEIAMPAPMPAFIAEMISGHRAKT